MAASGTEHAPALCDAALTQVFEILGKRWNGLILGSLQSGPVSFSTLSRGVVGISDSVLSERLTTLTKLGLVIRTVSSGPPVSVTYELSASGQALMPALASLTEWAKDNLEP